MKVIKDNYNNGITEEVEKTFKIRCSECESELEVTEEEMYIGWLGAYHIVCPCCGKEAMVDELEGIDITVSNVEFPTHFHKVSIDTGAIDIKNAEITSSIHRGVEFLREHKDEWAWYTSYGNLLLAIFKYDGENEYSVIVTKNFYEADIKFEALDYNK